MANNTDFFWNSSNVLKPLFQARFQLMEQKKAHWIQIWTTGWLGYKYRFVFRQKIAHKGRRLNWCIVVMQHPTMVHPQLRLFRPAASLKRFRIAM